MSFRSSVRATTSTSSVEVGMNAEELSYMIALIKEEGYEHKLNREIEKFKANLEAMTVLQEAKEEITDLQSEYTDLKSNNLEGMDSDAIEANKAIYTRAQALAHKLGMIDNITLTTNQEDLTLNTEGLITEIVNKVTQAYSNMLMHFGRFFKSTGTLFSAAINHRRRKLMSLKSALNEVNKFEVPKQVNDDFVEDYLCMLKLSEYDVEKTFRQIDTLQDYVRSMMQGKYPDGERGIDAKIDTNIPEIKDRADEIIDSTTYRNYMGMKLNRAICIGYQNRGETIRAYINFEFKVPKNSVVKAGFSIRDFKNVSYKGIRIIDGSDVIVRTTQSVIIGFRNDRKTIKFDKNIALRQIDAEFSRIDKIAKVILISNWQDIVKSYQVLGVGISTAFEKAIPMGLGQEVAGWMNMATGGPISWFFGMIFYGNTFTEWITDTYIKSYTGLVEMSKSNYEMLLDYCNAIINNQK